MTFDEYMQRVDEHCLRLVDLTTDDLVDYCYRDAYDSGMSAKGCAILSITNSGGRS